MGIFRLFLNIAEYLHKNPHAICSKSLEELCTCYIPYSYISNRRSLQAFLNKNLMYLPLDKIPPSLRGASPSELVYWWIGGEKNLTNSGLFPDFILMWQGTKTLGDGAILELKDSGGRGIASFNSTLPSAKKKLSSLGDTVLQMVRRVDDGPDERDCFYLVRTMRKDCRQVRLSIVHGTFFETLPTSELLARLWKDILEQAGIPPELQEKVSTYLTNLEREDIAQVREIPGASIKARLRVMSEIHSEGNPHLYPEILPSSFNLILKQPEGCEPIEWLWKEFLKEGIRLDRTSNTHFYTDTGIKFEVFFIHHKRNGKHIGVRYTCNTNHT